MTGPGATGPRISVVIPTFDRCGPLERALESVLTQTVPPHQVVVVDDGSTDGTAAMVSALAERHPSLRYLRQPQRSGAAAARNTGLDVVSGDLVAFQDSDDEWSPQFLERLLPATGPRGVVAFSSHRVHHRDGSSHVVPASPVADSQRVIPRTNVVSTQTILADARIFASGFRFDPDVRRFQDWDLWLTLLERRAATFVHVPEVLVELHRMDDSISEGSARVRDASLRRLTRKHLRFFLWQPRALARVVARGYLRPLYEAVRHAFRRPEANGVSVGAEGGADT